jgi:transposase-like protein
LGQVRTVDRAEYEGLELDAKVELILGLIPLGMMHVQEALAEEVRELAGERHARKGEGQRGSRYGTNPGSVKLGGQRVAIPVPRVRGPRGEIPLRSYQTLHAGGGEVNEGLLKRVLYGISCRNYERAAEVIPGAIGLSGSSVSRSFVEASAERLRSFQERDLSDGDYVAIFLDGKAFSDATMVIALGVTLQGEKRFLGLIETDTENEKVLTVFLRSLLARGLDLSQGVLVVIDGGKGLRAAVRRAFTKRALVQRCMWHKRENIVSHLPVAEQASWRRRLQQALSRPTEKEARAKLAELEAELEEINQSAAASLREGLEEVLTLHRLGLFAILGRSFKTTNCLENVNALVEERCAKVDCWKNSNQRHRWLATALIDIEPRLRRVMGRRHLPALRAALQRALKIEESTRSQERAA